MNQNTTLPRYHGFTCPVCGSHMFGTQTYHPDASGKMVPGRRTGHCQENQHSGNGCTFTWDRDDPVAEGVAIYTQTLSEWQLNYKASLPDTLAEVKPLEEH